MGATPIVRHAYREALERFGEPDGCITFDEPPPPDDSWPQRIDVLYWKDTAELDITTFATVGMCDRPMAKVAHRCELHFSIRAKADGLDLNRICGFCANLAVYPFANKTFFEWAQMIAWPGEIPSFPNCSALVLHPAFIKDGWDKMVFEDTSILIMNLVPITAAEKDYRAKNGPFSIFDYFYEKQIDVFRDR